jgi:predicted GTPase
MLTNWRAWVLVVLLVAPVLAYVGFGTLWLLERHWLLPAGALWIASGIVFALLAARWTRSERPILPPLDWDAPETFSPFDRQALALVESAAEEADTAALETLLTADLYINSGRTLTRRLAEHYHPLSEDPIERVPIVELLTALELAAEDLNRLCCQVPGGDLVTPANLKTAVQAAGYLQKASDLYSYLLPLFSPATGLVRLGTQQLMVKPAWKNMQHNLLRWFFRAYINRLGTHLIELYSGRLVIGANQYRRLTRRSARSVPTVEQELAHLVVAVAGARGAGKSSLIAALEQARGGDWTLVKARLAASGLDESLLEQLQAAPLVEVPGYTTSPQGSAENARDRATRRAAVEEAVKADLLILVVDSRRASNTADVAFAQAWDRWYVEHPEVEAPPALVVLTGVDCLEHEDQWRVPFNWAKGQSPREAAIRSRVETLRASLPPGLTEFVAVGLSTTTPFGVLEELLPALATLLHRAERTALIHHLHRLHRRSKAGRLVRQVGEHGRWLWNALRSGGKTPVDGSQTSGAK